MGYCDLTINRLLEIKPVRVTKMSVIDMSHVGDGCPRCGIECCHAEWVEWRRGDGSWVCGGHCDENGRHKPERDIRGMTDEQYWDEMADAQSY